jgi:5-formyltetrahydrofolate cyclo-ligase
MDQIESAKLALRDQIKAGRREIGLPTLANRAHLIATNALACDEIRRAATVAAYVSVGREPGTGPLLDALVDAGKRVILPLLQPDNDLDWAIYYGSAHLRTAHRGLLEPDSPSLGLAAVAAADVILVPGLAADRDGQRLGRGGGSYDRALHRTTGRRLIILNADEIVEYVPTAAHDRTVHGAITEEGVVRFPLGG